MTGVTLPTFLSGLFAMGLGVIGILFLRFWRQTGDGLFRYFAVAFWLMAIEQTARAFFRQAPEIEGRFYLLRLAAFALILFAILRKNMSSKD